MMGDHEDPAKRRYVGEEDVEDLSDESRTHPHTVWCGAWYVWCVGVLDRIMCGAVRGR